MPFQYAAKLICGKSTEFTPVANGRYFTTVNIHNPGRKTKFYYKFAHAKAGGDGAVSEFKEGVIDRDGAQYFDCRLVFEIFGFGAQLLDAFFVIECENPLDVIAVYTTNDANGKGVPAIDVERVFEREIREFTKGSGE